MRDMWIPLLVGGLIITAVTGCGIPPSSTPASPSVGLTPVATPTTVLQPLATSTWVSSVVPVTQTEPSVEKDKTNMNGTPIPLPLDPSLEKIVMQAKDDLAGRLAINSDQINLVELQSVTWRDGSLGCPQQGMVYIQAQVDGLLIRLSAGGNLYEYHSGGSRAPFLCKPSPSANLANLGAITPVPPSRVASTEAAAVSARPALVTVKPPMLPVAPVQGTPPAGWKTFDSSILGIAVDYPLDWSVTQQTDGATFASLQGAKILLQAIKADGMSSGNQQCATLINSYGLAADTCFDTASHTYSATFSLRLANGSTEWLRLSTMNQEALDVYKQMLNSLRLR